MRNYLLLLLICAVGLWLLPIATFYTRLLFIILLCGAFILAILTFWKLKPVRVTLFLFATILLFALTLPGRDYDKNALQDRFVRELRSYQGTRYFWGGESRLGIDCSGLIRLSLAEAELKLGFTTANPKLLRQGLSTWWHDATARQIGQGRHVLTYPIGETAALNLLDWSKLKPGDLAVTALGDHILAYVGEGAWAEADPGLHMVVVLTTPQPKSFWFRIPVKLVRLAALAPTQTPNSEDHSATAESNSSIIKL